MRDDIFFHMSFIMYVLAYIRPQDHHFSHHQAVKYTLSQRAARGPVDVAAWKDPEDSRWEVLQNQRRRRLAGRNQAVPIWRLFWLDFYSFLKT